MKSLRFSELSLDDYIRNIEEGYFLNAVKNGDYDRVNDRLYLFTQERSINEFIINHKTPIGTTLLDWVCARGDSKMLEILVKAGADVNIKNAHGKPPLCEAICNDQNAIVKQLLKYGASVQLALSSVKDIRVEHKAESLEHKAELLNQKEDQTLLGDNLNQHDPEN